MGSDKPLGGRHVVVVGAGLAGLTAAEATALLALA